MSCERDETATPPALAGSANNASNANTNGSEPRPAPVPVPVKEGAPAAVPEPGLRDAADELSSIRKDLTYLSHHVYRMVLALQVPPCTCPTCSARHVDQSNLILHLAANPAQPAQAQQPAQAHAHAHLNGVSESEPGSACQTPEMRTAESGLNTAANGPLPGHEKDYDTDMSSEDTATPALNAPVSQPPPYFDPAQLGDGGQLAGLSQAAALFGANPAGLMELSPEKLTALISAAQSGSFARGTTTPRRGRGSGAVGRRSKYCTAEEKAAVAAYATLHGASAAARKFNIPPAVAAYYHRKIYNKALPKGRRPMFGQEGPGAAHSPAGFNGQAPPTLVPRQERDSTPTMVPMEEALSAASGDHMGFQQPMQMQPGPGSADGGSPQRMSGNSGLGARVGSGKRGRPKLIGDDVDADLLEYLVKLRRELPTEQQLNAETVLKISTAFIQQRAPGLLVEDGGSVQLRPTWAMKMLMRMNEWDRLMPKGPNDASPTHGLHFQGSPPDHYNTPSQLRPPFE